MRAKKKIHFLLFFLGLSCFVMAKNSEDSTAVLPKKKFELSFGQSVLFISNSKQDSIRSQRSIVVPTSAILFFTELRPSRKLRIPIFFNLPTESKQFLVNGQLVNEKANPSFGTGLEFCCFGFKIAEQARMEMEVGPLASFIFGKGVFQFSPIIAGRIRLIKKEDFVIYMGGSYSPGINSFGLLYGTGYVF
jgi:hypothetical protein